MNVIKKQLALEKDLKRRNDADIQLLFSRVVQEKNDLKVGLKRCISERDDALDRLRSNTNSGAPEIKSGKLLGDLPSRKRPRAHETGYNSDSRRCDKTKNTTRRRSNRRTQISPPTDDDLFDVDISL